MSKNIKEIIPKWRFPEFMNSGQWEEKKIDTLGEYINGLNGKKSDDFGSGEPYIQYKQVFDKSYIDFSECGKVNIKDDEKQNAVQKGDVLFTTSSETPDEAGFASVVVTKPHKKTYLNSFCFILRPFDLEKTPSSFYRFLFQSSIYRKSVSAIAQGSTRYNLSKMDFLKLKIPIPPKPEEQQKIADCLSSIDDLISAEEKKLSLLNDYKKGWMQKLFTDEEKTVPEWRFPEFKDDNNWKCVEIETVGKVITGKTPPTSNDSLWNGSIQFVTPTDIVGDKYQRLVQRTVVKTSKMKVLPKGTIMFTCIASIGKMAISVYPCVTNQQINSIITNKGYYNEFIYYSLFRNVNKIKSDLSNTTVPIINKTDFSKIQISVTLNEKEQQKIADFLSGIDELISSQKEKIEKLKQHKKALMQGLFPSIEEVL